jgi:putative ABC transport system permease protein
VAVERRRREIGIRRALGASHYRVLRTVLARTAAQLGAGVFVGSMLLLGLRTLREGSLDLSSTLLALAGLSITMAIVGTAACFVPARRAMRVQPTEAIREVG